jgi:NAD(P)-dependent dehydrogenase (short-subunit alcohol dehydrogenase family)
MDLGLKDRIVVITGGAGAIGLAVARRFVDEGARVVLGDLAQRAVEPGLERLRAEHFPSVSFFPLDLRDTADVQRFAAQACAAYGEVDAVVNNAAVFHFQPLDAWVDASPLDEHYAVGVRGPLALVREIWARSPRSRSGAVVNVSSVAGHVGEPDAFAYTPIKAAQKGLTLALAIEMARHGGWSVTVSPGHTWTPVHECRALAAGLSRTDYEASSSNVQSSMFGRFLETDEVAAWIVLAASPVGRVLTGQDLRVTGGIEAGGFNRGYVTRARR